MILEVKSLEEVVAVLAVVQVVVLAVAEAVAAEENLVEEAAIKHIMDHVNYYVGLLWVMKVVMVVLEVLVVLVATEVQEVRVLVGLMVVLPILLVVILVQQIVDQVDHLVQGVQVDHLVQEEIQAEAIRIAVVILLALLQEEQEVLGEQVEQEVLEALVVMVVHYP